MGIGGASQAGVFTVFVRSRYPRRRGFSIDPISRRDIGWYCTWPTARLLADHPQLARIAAELSSQTLAVRSSRSLVDAMARTHVTD
jgi:hypothetical protein